MSARPSTVDGLVSALANSLRAKVLELSRAEQHRASFVFREDRAPGWRAASPADTAWAIHLARALHAATDPTALDLLASLRHDERTLDEIALAVRPRGDRLAAGAWIGDLASAGLVSRDLETDRVSLAPLGEAIVDLLETAAAIAAAPIEDPLTAQSGGAGPEP